MPWRFTQLINPSSNPSKVTPPMARAVRKRSGGRRTWSRLSLGAPTESQSVIDRVTIWLDDGLDSAPLRNKPGYDDHSRFQTYALHLPGDVAILAGHG